jgi:NADH-quinone oxidoreductase subunit A
MDGTTPIAAGWPLLAYALMAALLVAALLGLSALLGETHRGRDTDVPFESGVEPVHSDELRPSVHFYLVAVMFVIFDLEAVFLYAWAVSARASGWAGYLVMLLFVAVLGIALLWLVRRGVLSWTRSNRAATSHPQLHDPNREKNHALVPETPANDTSQSR